MAERVDIELQRNADWAPVLVFSYPDASPPDNPAQRIDMTGCTVAMQVRERLDITSGAPLATGTCEITDAINGVVEVTLLGSSGPLHNYGNPIQDVNLVYDIRVTDPDGIETIAQAGKLILSRGVTQ